jgi:hypothetical protein
VRFSEKEVLSEYGEFVSIFRSVEVFGVFRFPLGIGFEDSGFIYSSLSLEEESNSGHG